MENMSKHLGKLSGKSQSGQRIMGEIGLKRWWTGQLAKWMIMSRRMSLGKCFGQKGWAVKAQKIIQLKSKFWSGSYTLPNMPPDDAFLIDQSILLAIDRLQRIIVAFRGEIFEGVIWKFEQFVRPTKWGQNHNFIFYE